MARTTSSRKAKGRRLQQDVVRRILEKYIELTIRDVKSAPMGTFGEDVVLSEKASEMFPFSVECKNQEKLNIWKALQQSEQNNRELISMLVFKRNRSKTYVALDLDDFLRLI